MMIKFHIYDSSLHKTDFVEMNVSYLNWISKELLENFGIDIIDIVGSIEEYVRNSLPMFETMTLPESVIYIVSFNDEIAGMGGLKKYSDDIAEIKRMYVKPEYRGKGLGKALMNQLIETAQDSGYSKIRLDTGNFMKVAQRVYKNAGFYEIEEYPESEVPKEARSYWIYMEKIL